jgi:hypothetical protein
MYLAKPLIFTLEPCPPSGVYLRWLSPLGEWCGLLFAGDVDTSTDLLEPTDLNTTDGRATVAVRRAGTDTLTVRAGAGDLSTSQHEALSTILDSPQVYRQYPSGLRIPVLVSASATAPRTSADGKHELELEIKLPARNALTH